VITIANFEGARVGTSCALLRFCVVIRALHADLSACQIDADTCCVDGAMQHFRLDGAMQACSTS